MEHERSVKAAPTLAHLRAFRAVVEHDGFGAAAEALDTTQPAVSQHVRALERHYGLPLLDRLPRGVRLTEAGAVVYRRACALLESMAAMGEELGALRGLEGGQLILGASTTAGNYVLPALIGAFKARHPNIEVALDVENTEIIAAHVAAHRLALGFIEGPMPATSSPALRQAPFREDELVLVTAGVGLLAGRTDVSLDELATLPFLMREPGSGTRQVLEAALRTADVTLRPYLQLGHTEAIKTAIGLGMGVSILSRHAVARECGTGELRELPLRGLRIRRTYMAVALRSTPLAPAAAAFLAEAGVGSWADTP